MNELTVKCGRCGYTDERRKVDGILQEMPGAWSVVSVMLRPIATKMLCPSCTAKIVFMLGREDIEPVRRETLERLTGIADAARAAELEMVRSGELEEV